MPPLLMQLALRWVGFVVVVVVNNKKYKNYMTTNDYHDTCNTIQVEKTGRSRVVPPHWPNRTMRVPSRKDLGCINIVAMDRNIVPVDVINRSFCVNPMYPPPGLFRNHPDPIPHPFHLFQCLLFQYHLFRCLLL